VGVLIRADKITARDWSDDKIRARFERGWYDHDREAEGVTWVWEGLQMTLMLTPPLTSSRLDHLVHESHLGFALFGDLQPTVQRLLSDFKLLRQVPGLSCQRGNPGIKTEALSQLEVNGGVGRTCSTWRRNSSRRDWRASSPPCDATCSPRKKSRPACQGLEQC
jgi:hypothetical protein